MTNSTTNTTKKNNELTVIVPVKEEAKHLSHYLNFEDRKTFLGSMNSEQLEKLRTVYDGKDEILAVFVNSFKVKRTTSDKVKGEFIQVTRHKYADHKKDENYELTGKKDEAGNPIYALKVETKQLWSNRTVNKKSEEFPTSFFYPYPVTANAEKLGSIVGAALTELKNDQYRRKAEKRPTLRRAAQMHLQIFIGGKLVLNTQQHIFEGLPAGLLFTDFKVFASQMYQRAKVAAEKKTQKAMQFDVNAIFAD